MEKKNKNATIFFTFTTNSELSKYFFLVSVAAANSAFLFIKTRARAHIRPTLKQTDTKNGSQQQ